MLISPGVPLGMMVGGVGLGLDCFACLSSLNDAVTTSGHVNKATSALGHGSVAV